ncbi:unnamed protein product [Closterium sp. NIES-54]
MLLPRRFAPLLLLIAALLLNHQSTGSTWQERGMLGACASKEACEEQCSEIALEGKSDIFAEVVAAASDSAVPTDAAAAADGLVPPLADTSDAQTGETQSRAAKTESEAEGTEPETSVTQSEDVTWEGESSSFESQACGRGRRRSLSGLWSMAIAMPAPTYSSDYYSGCPTESLPPTPVFPSNQAMSQFLQSYGRMLQHVQANGRNEHAGDVLVSGDSLAAAGATVVERVHLGLNALLGHPVHVSST